MFTWKCSECGEENNSAVQLHSFIMCDQICKEAREEIIKQVSDENRNDVARLAERGALRRCALRIQRNANARRRAQCHPGAGIAD